MGRRHDVPRTAGSVRHGPPRARHVAPRRGVQRVSLLGLRVRRRRHRRLQPFSPPRRGHRRLRRHGAHADDRHDARAIGAARPRIAFRSRDREGLARLLRGHARRHEHRRRAHRERARRVPSLHVPRERRRDDHRRRRSPPRRRPHREERQRHDRSHGAHRERRLARERRLLERVRRNRHVLRRAILRAIHGLRDVPRRSAHRREHHPGRRRRRRVPPLRRLAGPGRRGARGRLARRRRARAAKPRRRGLHVRRRAHCCGRRVGGAPLAREDRDARRSRPPRLLHGALPHGADAHARDRRRRELPRHRPKRASCKLSLHDGFLALGHVPDAPPARRSPLPGGRVGPRAEPRSDGHRRRVLAAMADRPRRVRWDDRRRRDDRPRGRVREGRDGLGRADGLRAREQASDDAAREGRARRGHRLGDDGLRADGRQPIVVRVEDARVRVSRRSARKLGGGDGQSGRREHVPGAREGRVAKPLRSGDALHAPEDDGGRRSSRSIRPRSAERTPRGARGSTTSWSPTTCRASRTR